MGEELDDEEIINCDDCPDKGKVTGYIFSVTTPKFSISLTAPSLEDLVDMICLAEDLVNDKPHQVRVEV